MKKINKLFGIFALLALVFTGCSNSIMERSSDKVEYGSLISVSESKALDLGDLHEATVTVTGTGMDELSQTVAIKADGTGTFYFEKVPAGKNRIVTVSSNITGVFMRAIVDIAPGVTNPVAVSYDTTALGNVFHYLNKAGKNLAEIDVDAVENVIKSTNVSHAVLVDAEAIAKAYPNMTGNYALAEGTVTISTSGVDGYTVQVTDPSSKEHTANGSDATITAYPGNWKVKVIDDTGMTVAEKDIKVEAGLDSTVTVKKSGAEPTDSIVVYVPTNNSQGYTHIWAWTDAQNYTGGTWPGKAMDVQGSYYVYEIPTTSCSVILNKSGSPQTGDLSIASAGNWLWNGSSFEKMQVENPGEVTLTVTGPAVPPEVLKIYVSADSAPKIWVWTDSDEITKDMGYAWESQPTMSAAKDLNDNTNWYVFEIPSKYDVGEKISFILNGGDTIVGKDTTFWYDAKGVSGSAGSFHTSDPTKPKNPEAPSITITPANGKEVAANGTISVNVFDGYAQITALNVTISGAVSETYGISDFNNGTLNISVSSLGLKVGDSISVNATVTNTEGTDSDSSSIKVKVASTDYFTWDNVNAYFVLTDRFANGNSSNDHSYNRKNGLSGDENVATFHGGDIKGLTQNMDYFKKLGINAIWITAPYEQAHGWVSGKDKKFPHYAFHGYYTLDWTFMDKNMGTINEFREFVQACHANGIRVIMDIVMNHVGYNNTQDMVDYSHGKTSHSSGWLEKVGGVWDANDTVVWTNSLWESWWGPWIRSFGYQNGSEYGGSCGGLPDVKSEVSDTNIGIAPVLKTKWAKENNSSYNNWRVPAVANVDWWGKTGDWRTNKTARIVEYQCVWLSSWVREFGIDGFRCDTAKHVEPQYWGMLKDACTAALEKWRKDETKVDNSGAKDWDEAFWMTGECWGWTATGGGGEYYNQGKFDSMVNFSFNGGNNWDGNYRQNYPQESAWGSYLNINNNGDSDGNGNRDNVLTYISSHDTGLTRVGSQYEVGTGLVLLPGGVQIFYGDESSRPKAYTGCGDGDMMTRGDMNLNEAKTSGVTAHWGKVGNFRKYNPAVGAGKGSACKRTYTGPAGDNKVAIGVNGASVDVSGLFTDGTLVYNWYDGKSATVSGGKVSFSGGSMKQPILVSDRNPADCGVTF